MKKGDLYVRKDTPHTTVKIMRIKHNYVEYRTYHNKKTKGRRRRRIDWFLKRYTSLKKIGLELYL